MLRERLERVRERIEQACQRCGRHPSSITLIGVTKGVPSEVVREVLALGLTAVGENRVQEARAKQAAVGLTPGVRWHLIGHLQRNKAKDAVTQFDVIHSVDSVPLIEELARQAQIRRRHLEVLIQVNVSGESTKFGCRPDEASALAEAIAIAPPLKLAGLMTLAPYVEDPEHTRPIFRHLRHLRDALQSAFGTEARRHGGTPLLLSMGMSQDFEVAIEEGADFIRVGTAIFGPRDMGHGP